MLTATHAAVGDGASLWRFSGRRTLVVSRRLRHARTRPGNAPGQSRSFLRATDCLAALTELVANLPMHTVRSEKQIELQQFATPAKIAISLRSPAGSRSRVWSSSRLPTLTSSQCSRAARPLAWSSRDQSGSRSGARRRLSWHGCHALRRRADPRSARTNHPADCHLQRGPSNRTITSRIELRSL